MPKILTGSQTVSHAETGLSSESNNPNEKNIDENKIKTKIPVSTKGLAPKKPPTRPSTTQTDTDSFISTKGDTYEDQPLPARFLFDSILTNSSRKNSNESDDSVTIRKPDRSIFVAEPAKNVLKKKIQTKKLDSSEIESDSSLKIARFEAKKGDDESITLEHDEISDVDSIHDENTNKN